MQCCTERVLVSCTVSSALDQCIGTAGFPGLGSFNLQLDDRDQANSAGRRSAAREFIVATF